MGKNITQRCAEVFPSFIWRDHKVHVGVASLGSQGYIRLNVVKPSKINYYNATIWTKTVPARPFGAYHMGELSAGGSTLVILRERLIASMKHARDFVAEELEVHQAQTLALETPSLPVTEVLPLEYLNRWKEL